jgi:NAD(P)H-dependent nitrite reductase small subunit
VSTGSSWQDVCAVDDILLHTGECALVEGRQVAVFRTASGLFAIANADPIGRANVLARGIVGDLGGRLVVASPLYKHHFELETGLCVEDPTVAVRTWKVRERDGRIEVEAEGSCSSTSPARKRLVLVGNGLAGLRMLEELRKLGAERYEITVFGAEPRGGYNRVMLSGLLAGETSYEEIAGHDRSWYEERDIALHTGDPVVAIDRVQRIVLSRSGVRAPYDRLVLATGSTPVRLDVPGADLPGVRCFRDLDDVEAMLEAARGGGRAVVVGGGVLGIEAADGLLRRGMSVTLVHNAGSLMNRQLDAEAGDLLREELERRGLAFRMGARVAAVQGKERAEAVLLADGSRLPAELVVTAIGVSPHVDLARRAGLQCGRGILVDDTMQTFDPRIWAVGECVQHRRATFGMVAPLWEQARVCAVHLAELGASRYRPPLPVTQLKVPGIRVFAAGDLGDGEGCESIVLRDRERGIYKRLLLRDNKVRGAVLYGDVGDGARYCDLMRGSLDVAGLREGLLFGEDAPQAQVAP